MSKVVFIRGYPRTGKSTLASYLAAKHPLKYAIIDPENVIFRTTYSPNSIELKKFRYKINLRDCVDLLKQGYDVLWVQPWRIMDGLAITIENINIMYTCPVKFSVLEMVDSPEAAWERAKIKLTNYNKQMFLQKFVAEHEKFNLKNVEYRSISLGDKEKVTI